MTTIASTIIDFLPKFHLSGSDAAALETLKHQWVLNYEDMDYVHDAADTLIGGGMISEYTLGGLRYGIECAIERPNSDEDFMVLNRLHTSIMIATGNE